MPPRRHVERPVSNLVMEREMREICAILDAMDITQIISPDVGDFSDAEREEMEV